MKMTGTACWPFSRARCLRCTASSVAHGQEEGEEAAPKEPGLASASGFAGLMARLAEGDAYVIHFWNTCFSDGLVSHKSPADIAETDGTHKQHASNPRRNTYAFQTKDAQHVILVPQSM